MISCQLLFVRAECLNACPFDLSFVFLAVSSISLSVSMFKSLYFQKQTGGKHLLFMP